MMGIELDLTPGTDDPEAFYCWCIDCPGHEEPEDAGAYCCEECSCDAE